MGDQGDQLVGRTREQTLLVEALDGLRTGTRRLLEIAGEPGIGKTRLLRELHALARDRRNLVLDGRGAEFETNVPFGMFVDAVDDYLGSLQPDNLVTALGSEYTAELAAVFPSLAPLAGEGARRLEAERFKAHFAVRRLLEHLAAKRPVLLMLDDVHWADPASVELLDLLLRRPPRGLVLVALAHRPHQTPSRLARSLDRADREGLGTRLELGPLTAAEVDELLEDGLSEAARATLYRESGGNPFYLEQLARAWDLKGADALEHTDAPQAVAAAIEAELASLPRRARTLLEGAAVAGDAFDPELAAAAAGLAPAESLSRLDELIDRDLVRHTEIPRLFRFRHPIVRRTVYQSAKPGWRVAAHARAAAELSARSVPPQGRAHHVESSARVGDEEAIALLREAGCTVAPRAPATAARWFEAALRLLPAASGRDGERVELVSLMAASLGAAGELEASHAAVSDALGMLGADATAPRLEMVTFCASLENLMGRYDAARSRLHAALGELRDRDSRAAAVLELEVAANSYYVGDYGTARDAALAALEIARDAGNRALLATAAALSAFAAFGSGRPAEGRRLLDEAVAAFDRMDDDELAERLDAAFWLGWAEVFCELAEDATAHFERGIAVSRATGRGQLVIEMQQGIAWALMFRGRLAEALELSEAALEAARVSGIDLSLSWALAGNCWIALAAGDLPAARRAGEESVARAEGFDEGVIFAVAGWTLAAALVEAGEPARCAELIPGRAGGPGLPRLIPFARCLCYEILTTAQLAQGDVEAADRWAIAAEGQARTSGRLAGAYAARARAAVELARDDAEASRDAALGSVAAAERAGAPVESGRSRLLAAAALEALGQREAAVAELERARDDLDRCGAARYRDQAIGELRRLGRRVSADGAGRLTPREREVAQLVAGGASNRQVADELVLSVRTVERHMENIFRKLGVRTRAGVAAAAARELVTHRD